MAKKGDIFIGTSGWMYKDWGAMFYPKGMKKGFLQYLSAEFPTVEVNSSFYHLPLASTFEKWRLETPEHFVFAVKISRFITHQKKLQGVSEPVNRFLSRAKRMEEKLGVVLIQLPPSLQFEARLLTSFTKRLAAARKKQRMHFRFALEPRHKSWFEPQCLKKLRNELRTLGDACIVFPHSARIPSAEPSDENITADFTYVRFHGPSEFAASRYGEDRLKPWAKRIKAWQKRGLTTFVYFNNGIHGHAIVDARTLRDLLAV